MNPYNEDPARQQQLKEEYRTKRIERTDRIAGGRVETIDKYIQQNCIRQLRDQSQEMLDELSNLDQLPEEIYVMVTQSMLRTCEGKQAF